MTKKRVFIHLIGTMEFAQQTNVRDFVGPFTTSCERPKQESFLSVEQIRSLAEVMDTVGGPTQLFNHMS